MAKCDVCNGEMLEVNGCSEHLYVLKDGTKVKPVKVGEEGDWYYGEPNSRCSDCNASYGHTHHFGCDVERCRVCHGQLITCYCDYAPKLAYETKNTN